MKKIFLLFFGLILVTGAAYAETVAESEPETVAKVQLTSQKYVDDTFEAAKSAENITKGHMLQRVLPIGDAPDEIVSGDDNRFYSFSVDMPKLNGLTQEEYQTQGKDWNADLKEKLGTDRVLVWIAQ